MVKLMTINVIKVVLLRVQGFIQLIVVTLPRYFLQYLAYWFFNLLFIFHTLRTLREFFVFRGILNIPLITLFIFMFFTLDQYFSTLSSLSPPRSLFRLFFLITPLPYEILIPQIRAYLFMCCVYVCALSLVRLSHTSLQRTNFYLLKVLSSLSRCALDL